MERSRRSELRTVVFDLGEVLASPTDLYPRLAELLSSDVERVQEAYWMYRDAHDRGSSIDDYWGEVATAAGGTAPGPELTSQLAELDSTAWTSIRPDAESLLRRLDAAGTPVAILSNAPAALAIVARRTAWAPYVDEWFFSGELALAKPDSQIYALVTGRLDVPTDSIVFFDDRPANVEAALAFGWDAHLWISDEQTRDVLIEMGVA